MSDVTDEQISEYMNEYYAESEIQRLEENILHIMKYRQETYPSEKNDKEWFNFSDQMIKRRCRSHLQ